MRLVFTKFERRCTKVQQSKDFVKVLENTIKINIPFKNNNELHIKMKLVICLIYSFKDVNNPFVFSLRQRCLPLSFGLFEYSIKGCKYRRTHV